MSVGGGYLLLIYVIGEEFFVDWLKEIICYNV